MKKFLFLILFGGLLVSCDTNYNPQPIEKYKGENYVIIEDPYTFFAKNFKITRLRVKSQDTLKIIYVSHFDARDLRIGDTIK